jgi:hypothetical protein
LKVARLLNCWEQGLGRATSRFLEGIRRLDLPDYIQVRDLLLNFEGQPLGSYLLDVFDRILQHEIEGELSTIDAAEELNTIDTKEYPAPYIAGSSDLQTLVYRTIWQNPRRLKVTGTIAPMPASFGDVFVRRSVVDAAPAAADDGKPDVFAVLTPACDLMREGTGAKRILLLGGVVSALSPKTWAYGAGHQTPIMIVNDKRFWIKWDLKDISALTPEEVTALLGENGTHSLALRLRESYTLELQQKLLASIGRVGLVAHMPATFPVSFEVSYLAADESIKNIHLPKAALEGGVCYVGKDAKSSRLVLTEAVIDELLIALGALVEDGVFARSREALRRLKASSAALARDLEKGLAIPAQEKPKFTQIKVPGDVGRGQPVEMLIGLVVRNPGDDLNKVSGFDQNNAALLIVLNDQVAH